MSRNSREKSAAFPPAGSADGFDNIIGRSARMREIFSKIRSVADKDILVLIGGESGTGKELVAQAIHNNSHRKNAPYIKVNCAAIPDALIESELFGHEKGSFTGAHQRKIGKFELANNGTIFLDEIGDMALATQSKVLRIIQEREFERLGGVRPVKVNVRIITATHRDLLTEVAQKRFREDLFFRINVVSLLLPPLRERRDDIELLGDFFLAKFCGKFNKPLKRLSREVIDAFMGYGWPGNVRELQNVIESAVAIEESDLISFKSLPYPILTSSNVHLYGRRKTDRAEGAGSAAEPSSRAAIPAGNGVIPGESGRGGEDEKRFFPRYSRGGSGPEGAGTVELSGGGIGAGGEESALDGAVEALIDAGLGLDQIERRAVLCALKKSGGRQLGAARILGIGRGEMQYKIKKFNIACGRGGKNQAAAEDEDERDE